MQQKLVQKLLLLRITSLVTTVEKRLLATGYSRSSSFHCCRVETLAFTSQLSDDVWSLHRPLPLRTLYIKILVEKGKFLPWEGEGEERQDMFMVSVMLIGTHYDNSTCIVGYFFQESCTEIFWSVLNIKGLPKEILQQRGINTNVIFFIKIPA